MRYIFFVNRVQLTTCLHLPANCFGFKDQEIDTEPTIFGLKKVYWSRSNSEMKVLIWPQYDT
ncbi:BFP_1a_G0002510.mRNA.1.CDS.1 [Saccharomyces cerevisiae]|nr:BFP_1a_G0002510.mRNA.1.CDS.1 [Saccharomyces cerevisiae]CAI7042646.1 BFP_1a_G0002510.mRNA.1.CDS.1 [Saccharomyces cerevisiae]